MNLSTLTQHLIKFKTISHQNQDEFEKLFDFVRMFLDMNGSGVELDFREIEYGNRGLKLKSLFIKPKNVKKVEILLAGHVDVVEAGDDQFESFEKDGQVFGRGSQDMKGAVAVNLLLFKEMLKESPSLPIGLFITPDEETTGRGSEILVEVLKEENALPKVVIFHDGGDEEAIVQGEKGFVFGRVKFVGKASHGSKPFLGENAIENIFKFAKVMRSKFPQPESENDWRTSFSFNVISGGQRFNMTAEEAEVTLDIRFTSEWSSKKLIDLINLEAEKIGKHEFQVDLISEGFYVYDENPYFARFRSICDEHFSRETKIVKSLGGSDGRYFGPAGCTVLMSLPDGGDRHSEGERVSVKSLEKLYRINEKFVRDYFEI